MTNRWSRVARRIRVPMGFLFAVFFLFEARPTVVSLASSLLFVVPGLLLRAYASGYVRKNSALAVTGPYAYTRNPLYLGSAILAFGFAWASHSVLILLLLIVLFIGIYWPTILSEEEFLRSRFPEFEFYAKSVPRFFPRFLPPMLPAKSPDSPAGGFSRALYWEHREYNSFLGACAVYAILLGSLLFRH